jgi:hypothetical protein
MRLCVICGRELPEGRDLTCVACELVVGRQLDDLVRLWPLLLDRCGQLDEPAPWKVVAGLNFDPDTYEASLVPRALLPAELVPAGPTRQISRSQIRGVRHCPVPANLDLLDLIGGIRPASLTVPPDPEVQVGYIAVATELDFWVKDWAGYLGLDLPGAEVPELAQWLRAHLAWACGHHFAVDEFAAKLERLAGVVRHWAGESDDRMKVGRCPAVRDGRTCGATLKADAWLDVIECPRCTTRWHRSQWLILAGTAREER